MKVLMINSVAGIGSTGRICVELCTHLEDKGVKTSIAYGRAKNNSRIETYKIGTIFNNYMHVLETRLIDNHGYSSRVATKKLIKYIQTFEPDVIHLHNLHGYYINIEILFRFLSKIYNGKVIVTMHDTWLFSGHSATIDNPNMSAKENEKNDYPKTFFFNMYDRNFKRKSQTLLQMPKEKMVIVTPSQWLANMIGNTFLEKYKCYVINNGVDQNIFKREYMPKEQQKKILFITNIWNRDKGLEVVNEVADKLNQDEYKVIIVGKLPPKFELSEKIEHITQTQDIKELSDIYNSASVYVNPTFKDNFPTTNLEAISCGVPIVTFDTGGCKEVIDDNHEFGCSVKQGDIKELIRNIKKYSKLENREQISEYAKKYSKKVMLDKYVSIIEDISYNKIEKEF